jgi:hypothetical protein
MSRTYRRKSGEKPTWLGIDWVDCYKPNGHWSHMVRIKLDPKSKQAVKELAKYHSDSWYKHSSQWPGWALAKYVQKPYRVETRRQLSNFKKDNEYEVTLRSIPKKSWWD